MEPIRGSQAGFAGIRGHSPLFTLREGTVSESVIEAFLSPLFLSVSDEPPAASRS